MAFPGVAVVTGAGGTGIGSHVALAFADEGCGRIAITDINEESLNEVVSRIQEKHASVEVFAKAGDISDTEFVSSFMESVRSTFGRLDYAVNCAGIITDDERSSEMSVETFDLTNNVNYRGCWLSSRAELALMLKQEPLPSHSPLRPPQRGAIVNVASQLGLVSRPFAPAYCASKGAVIAMTRSDAIDYSADHIRVNCICPGLVRTPMTTSTKELEERMSKSINNAPMKRMGFPEEIADAILFLCSTKASFVQGHAMVVDGGYIIN